MLRPASFPLKACLELETLIVVRDQPDEFSMERDQRALMKLMERAAKLAPLKMLVLQSGL